METVWITHPKLPGRKVRVPASSLWQHQRAGWEETDPPPPPEPPQRTRDKTPQAPATAGASALPDKESPKARRIKGDE